MATSYGFDYEYDPEKVEIRNGPLEGLEILIDENYPTVIGYKKCPPYLTCEASKYAMAPILGSLGTLLVARSFRRLHDEGLSMTSFTTGLFSLAGAAFLWLRDAPEDYKYHLLKHRGELLRDWRHQNWNTEKAWEMTSAAEKRTAVLHFKMDEMCEDEGPLKDQSRLVDEDVISQTTMDQIRNLKETWIKIQEERDESIMGKSVFPLKKESCERTFEYIKTQSRRVPHEPPSSFLHKSLDDMPEHQAPLIRRLLTSLLKSRQSKLARQRARDEGHVLNLGESRF